MTTQTKACVIGVEIAGTAINIAVLRRGSYGEVIATPDLRPLQMAAAGNCTGENLAMTLESIRAVIRHHAPDRIGVIRADKTSGVDRTKLEALLELASFEAKTSVMPYHITSIRAFQKKHAENTDLKKLLAQPPRYLERAKLCALKGLMDA